MNDRFLFRGKRMDTGEWIIGSLCSKTQYEGREPFVSTGTLKSVIAIQYEVAENYYSIEVVDPATVGQCTSLKDKNDKLIFEGDVLRSSYGRSYVAEWDEENARFLGFTIENERRIAYVGREPKSEIIGNIHDNPNLLNGAARISDEHAEQNGLQYAT